jgi:hypothetical protein
MRNRGQTCLRRPALLGSPGRHLQPLDSLNYTLCGCGIETSVDYAVCETFTALYDALGGIGSGAMIPLSLCVHFYGVGHCMNSI